MKNNILILGCNGFIGSNIFKGLSVDYNINCASVSTSELELLRLIELSEVIVHTIGVTRSINENDFFDINITFSHRLYNILKSKKGKKLIYFSSIHFNRNDIYGFSKRYNEYLFSKIEIENAFQSYIIRTPGVFGPGSKTNSVSVVSTFCYNIAHNIECEIHDHGKVIEIVFINDIVSIVKNIIENVCEKFDNYIFPVSTKLTITELFNLIQSFSENVEYTGNNKMIDELFIKKLLITYNSFKNDREY